ncbi:MAG TPA: PLP-dependent aspartate aminotransferase family protein, partial [Aestuariivirga sp.]|nr:PLP-dependent aspartate aminotransferase family protein [Aestuariivirga sp.]
MSDRSNSKPSIRTTIAQAGHFIDSQTGAVIPAIQPSTTFARKEDYSLVGNYIYSRNGSPTVAHAEGLLCELEEGFETRLFASGMGAASALVETVESGQRIAAPTIMYHGVKAWMLRQQAMRNVGIDLFDAADPASLARAIIPGKTAIVWIETPVNPTWDVIDIRAAADAAHAAGAILVVDSTCAPPAISKPLTLGADIVFHSATKYLNGHSDVTAGVLTAREGSPRWEALKQAQIGLGATLGSFEAYLLIRGLRTLFLRVEQASRNALALARHFEKHPKLAGVLYPGLESHPQHKIARKQMTGGFGGMLSILVKGDETQTRRVAGRLKVFTPATSLGGVESLAEHRKS